MNFDNFKNYGNEPNKELLDRAEDGSLTDVRIHQLLALNADINTLGDYDWNAAYYASLRGHAVALSALMKNGVNVEQRDRGGCCPLHYAAKSGNIECVDMLLDANVDIGAEDNRGTTALHFAAEQDNCDIVKLFIDKGVAVDYKNRSNQTPLMNAAMGGAVNALHLLLDAKAVVDATTLGENTALHMAVRSGNPEAVRVLIEAKANVTVHTLTGETPLLLMAEHGHTDCLHMLLDAKANLSACTQGRRGGDRGRGVIHIAAQRGHGRTVKALISAQANIHANDDFFNTALHLAAAERHDEVLEILLNAGASPHVYNLQLQSPITNAVQAGFSKGVRRLLEAKSSLWVNFNNVPLVIELGLELNDPEILQLLASQHAANQDGFTPLMWAASTGRMSFVEALVGHGADMDAEDMYGTTAALAAEFTGQSEARSALTTLSRLVVDENYDVKQAVHAVRSERLQDEKMRMRELPRPARVLGPLRRRVPFRHRILRHGPIMNQQHVQGHQDEQLPLDASEDRL